jgi:hypothetical protein
MLLFRTARAGAVVLIASLAACSDGKDAVSPRAPAPGSLTASPTAASGSTSTPLGRSTFSDPKDPVFKVKRITGNWQFELRAKPAFDIAVQSIDFPAGSSSGWHSHPGPVFIQVVKGSIAFYESDDPTCTPIIKSAGEGYLDVGEHAHFARNESGVDAQNIVTYFAPPGAKLRNDEPRPGNCPF